MKRIIEYLEKIEQAQGTNNKKEILVEMFKVVPEAREFFEKAYDNANYGVSTRSFEKICNYDKTKDGVYFDAGELMERYSFNKTIAGFKEWKTIKEALLKIQELSGNKLLECLSTYYEIFSDKQAKWITRLILKDLKIGVSLITINKVLESLGMDRIEKWAVQLCGKFDEIDDPDIARKVGFPCISSTKYDGERGFLIKKGNKVTFTSRNGENIEYVPELIDYFKHYGEDFILDGEIMCKDFSTLQKRIGRKEENLEPVEGLHFRCFDIIQKNGKSYIDKTQQERTELLLDIPETKMFKREENVMISNYQELKEFFDLMVKRKEEGIILKNLDARYDFDSRKNWWKIKPYFENTFKIIDKKLGTGKKAGLISSVLIEDGGGKIKSWVGAGFTDNDILLLMNLDRENKLIGSFLDIRYNEITKDKFGNESLRFPRVLKIRLDKREADKIL